MSSPYLSVGPTAALAASTFSGSRRLIPASRSPLFAAAALRGGGGEQDHYAILGVPRNASAADVKHAYRSLARKYHPDVSSNAQAVEIFKSINSAYQVLSDEVSRAQYDLKLVNSESREGTLRNSWTWDPEYDEAQRMYRWAEVRQRMRYEKAKRRYYWHRKRASGQQYVENERGVFGEVVRLASMLFFLKVVGCRVSLTFCSIMALLDTQLDAGYKMGYVTAWFLGGRGGVLLSIFIYFTSWFFGKNSSRLVALAVLAMWLAANLARFVPLPHGAILTLLYMSIKFQDDSS